MNRREVHETGLSTGLGDISLKPKSNGRRIQEVQKHDEGLNLLYKVGKKVEAESELSELLDEIMQMTQQALKASASSVLLMEEETGELFFETAKGKAGNNITQKGLKVQSGIAPWVAHHGKPVIINDVNKDQRFNKNIDEDTGFVTRSILCAPLVVGRKTIGVIEVLNKLDGDRFNNQDLKLLTPLASMAALAIDNVKLHQSILGEYIHAIKMLSATIDAKDPYTYGHSQRVMEYALLAGVSLSLPREELQTIEYGGILHDIGKIAVDEAILRKPASLTPEEWATMRSHSSAGASIISDVPFLEEARKLVLHHHERYGGTGYPGGLKGEDIPLGARLLAVADAFDTMTTNRSYRAALSVEYALTELRRCTGTQFCPVAVEAFISGLDKHQKTIAQPSPQVRTRTPLT